MKKFISAFLSVVMLLSFAMGMNLTVFADDSKTITSASLTPIKPYIIYKGAYDYYNDGVGYYWTPDFNAGDIINITFSDETKATYTYYVQNDRQGWFASNNDEITVGGNSFYADKLGETYVSYCINDFDFDIENVPVTVVENPVESFSLTPAKAYEIIECTHGRHLDEENETDWIYAAPDFNEGDKITVNYTDGTSEEYIYKLDEFEEYHYIRNFVNDNNEILNVESYGFELDGTGKTTFEVKLPDYGKTTNVPVIIIKNPISSFSFTPIIEYTVIENSGEMDDEECYYDAPDFNDGDKITVNYTNGTSDVFIYVKNSDYFFNEKNETIAARGYGFFYTGTGKTTFDVELPDYGKTINVPVTVVENPVDSFSFTSVNPYEVEHSKGYAEDEDWWLEAPDFNKGDYVTVYFKDGTHDVYTCKEDGGCEFYNSNNEMVTVYSYEFSFNGTGTTSFTVKLYEYGKTQQVPVTVVDNSSSGSTSGGSTSGGSTSGGGSTGGGGAAPAPTTDDSQKTEEQKPSTSTTTTTTTSTQTPATVKVSKTKAKKNGVVVTWKTAKDVTGYEIQLATDKKFKKNKKTIKVNKKNASKKTVKKLKSKKKYYVRVRSYKIVNGKKVYGKWSKVKAVKTK